jgi:hypothetical protein
VSCLQQSVEKTAKACAVLFHGSGDVALPRDIGHDLLKAVRSVGGKAALGRVLGTLPSDEVVPAWAAENLSRAQEAATRAEAFLARFELAHPKGTTLSLEEVDGLIGAAERYRAAGRAMAAARLRTTWPEFVAVLGEGSREVEAELSVECPRAQDRRRVQRKMARAFLLVLRTIHGQWILVPLCLLLRDHAIEARYGRNGREPRAVYDASHPLVLRITTLLDLQTHVLRTVRTFVSRLGSLAV